MRKVDASILRQTEITLKQALWRCRKKRQYDPRTILALARLLKEYTALKAIEQGPAAVKEKKKFEVDYHTLLCSKEGVPMQDPSKIKIIKRR